jgi:hypothetical protein
LSKKEPSKGGYENAEVSYLGLVVNASGVVQVRTTALLTPEEVDAATRKTTNYRAPGA